MDKLKQTKNLFKKVIKDEKGVFYAVDRINRLLLGKDKKSLYKKDKAFYNHYLYVEDKNILYENEDLKKSVPFYTPFVEQRKDIDRSSALYSIKTHFERMLADITDIQFFFQIGS